MGVQRTPQDQFEHERAARSLWDDSDDEEKTPRVHAKALPSQALDGAGRGKGGHRRQLSSPLIARLQDTITGEANDIESLTKQLLEGDEEDMADPGAVLEKISALKQDIGTVTSFSNLKHHQGLASILTQVTIYEEYLKSLRGEAQGLALSAKERAYEVDARTQFDMVEVPADGNCLFASVGLHLHALHLQIWGEGLGVSTVRVPHAPLAEGEAPPPTAHRTGLLPHNESMLPWDATAQMKALPAERKAQLAAQVRAEVVASLLHGGEWCAAVGQEIGEALRGGRSDPTSKALREEAAKVWGEGDQEDAVLQSEAALEVYARVMAREAFFGERLELQLLPACVDCPIMIYYYPGQHSMGTPITPNEVFGAERPGEPIRLLHSIRGNHFQLLRPRPPTAVDRSAPPTASEGAGSATPDRKRSGFMRFFFCT